MNHPAFKIPKVPKVCSPAAFAAVVSERTKALRDATVAQHLGEGQVGGRLGRALDAFLEAFATTHVFGEDAAYGFLEGAVGYPEVSDAERIRRVPQTVMWTPLTVSRLFRRARADGAGAGAGAGRLGFAEQCEVFAALEAAGGIATLLSMEGTELFGEENATALPRAFGMIACAYATGVVIARSTGRAEVEVADGLGRVREALVKVEWADRVTLEARFCAVRCVEEMGDAEVWAAYRADGCGFVASALGEVWAAAWLSAGERRRWRMVGV